jgi:hypothetical protein
MADRSMQIDGRKFRIVPEAKYRKLQAAYKSEQAHAKQDAADLAVARRRLKDPKRKVISVSRLKADLGL